MWDVQRELHLYHKVVYVFRARETAPGARFPGRRAGFRAGLDVAPDGNRIPDCPAHSLVTIPTGTSWLLKRVYGGAKSLHHVGFLRHKA